VKGHDTTTGRNSRMKEGIQNDKNAKKAIIGPTRLFAGVGLMCFFMSLVVSTFLIGSRAEKMILGLQKETKAAEVSVAASYLEQFLSTHLQVIGDIASLPIVIGGVMQSQIEVGRAKDYLDNLKILGAKENLTLVNVAGEVIYRNYVSTTDTVLGEARGSQIDAKPVVEAYGESKQPWFSQILAGEKEYHISLIKFDEDDGFLIAVPVMFQGYVEGVFVVELATGLDKVVQPLIEGKEQVILLTGREGVSYSSLPSGTDMYELIQSQDILNSGVSLEYYVKKGILTDQKHAFMRDIAFSIMVSLVFSFVILLVFGKKMLLNPFHNLQDSQNRLRLFESVFAYSNDGVMITDSNFGEGGPKIVMVNEAICKMTGYRKEELVGNTPRILQGEGTSREELDRLRDLAMKGQTYKGRILNYTKDGDEYWLSLSVFPIPDEDGNIVNYAAIERDVTQEICIEDSLKAAKEDAEKATELKSQFLATMSHEIRTPMNGIIGMTELLMDSDLTTKQRQYATTLIGSAESLLELINDILDFSKVEAGKVDLEILPFDLLEVVEELASLMSIRAKEKGVELIVRYKPDVPRFLRGDRGRVRQVIANYVSNAIKFTESGYVLLTIEKAAEYSVNDGQGVPKSLIRVSVQDTGIGVSKEAQTVIFDKFSQADSSMTRKFGGTGLGLAICKQLSELMGGEVGVNSKLGEGSTFWSTMMFEHDDMGAGLPGKLQGLEGVRVLVVDDVTVNCEILKERLTSLGMRCDVCVDPEVVLDKMKAAYKEGHPYEFVLLDYLMPSMTGEDLAIRIRQVPELNNTILMLITSVGGGEIGKRLRSLGMAAVLNKPFRIRQLEQELYVAWLRRSQKLDTAEVESIIDSLSEEDVSAPIEPFLSFQGTQILLAEDNRTNQTFMQEILSSVDCIVDIVGNGKKAVEAVQNKSYDLIFMDCKMPEMDGYEASEALREMFTTGQVKEVPIVALTASVMEGDRERCLDAGMSDYIAKPVRKQDIFKVLQRWLSHKLKRVEEDEGETNNIADEKVLQMAEAEAAIQNDESKLFYGRKALLVEDNFTNRIMAEEMLKDLGFEISFAKNGKIAVAEVLETEFDVVLMDIQMPVMDGYEATKTIRTMIENKDIPDVPIIAVTANALKNDRAKCIEIGMCDYISKPVRKKILTEILLKWVEPTGTEGEKAEEIEKMNMVNVAQAEDAGFSAESFSHYLDVMEERAVEGVVVFLRETEKMLKELNAMWDEKNIAEVHSLAHSLKSSCSIMGAERMSVIAREIEEATHIMLHEGGESSGTLNGMDSQMVAKMQTAFDDVAPEFQKFLNEAQGASDALH
jgi:PAS domain S-box-containing protein